ncbi:MAG: PEPxxWA-CTERM sorting domain-containing protein [Pseudomonadota bacterium]
MRSPEPASWTLLVGGFCMLGASLRGRRRGGAVGPRLPGARA